MGQAEARRRNNSQVTRSRLDPSQFEDRESGPAVAQASYDMGRRARSQTGGSPASYDRDHVRRLPWVDLHRDLEQIPVFLHLWAARNLCRSSPARLVASAFVLAGSAGSITMNRLPSCMRREQDAAWQIMSGTCFSPQSELSRRGPNDRDAVVRPRPRFPWAPHVWRLPSGSQRIARWIHE